jgi:cytochrome d ubiquinol oxidase subunit II
MALVAGGHGLAARFIAAGAVALIVVGWVAAQSPYLLPGELTLHQAAAPQSTLIAVFVSFCAGAVILVPSLLLLYRLMLRGQLDKEYAAADEALR